MLDVLLTPLRYIFALIRNLLVEPLLDLYAWLSQFIADVILPFILARLPDGLVEFFEGLDVAEFAGLIVDVAWILPVWTLLAIYAQAWILAGSIRLVRWILAFIPTIGG